MPDPTEEAGEQVERLANDFRELRADADRITSEMEESAREWVREKRNGWHHLDLALQALDANRRAEQAEQRVRSAEIERDEARKLVVAWKANYVKVSHDGGKMGRKFAEEYDRAELLAAQVEEARGAILAHREATAHDTNWRQIDTDLYAALAHLSGGG